MTERNKRYTRHLSKGEALRIEGGGESVRVSYLGPEKDHSARGTLLVEAPASARITHEKAPPGPQRRR